MVTQQRRSSHALIITFSRHFAYPVVLELRFSLIPLIIIFCSSYVLLGGQINYATILRAFLMMQHNTILTTYVGQSK
jgi:hypothetical protein